MTLPLLLLLAGLVLAGCAGSDESGEPVATTEVGESVSVSFPEAGTYDYVCTLHSHDMTGRVVVR